MSVCLTAPRLLLCLLHRCRPSQPSPNSLLISLLLTPIFPSLLCPILLWLSWLLCSTFLFSNFISNNFNPYYGTSWINRVTSQRDTIEPHFPKKISPFFKDIIVKNKILLKRRGQKEKSKTKSFLADGSKKKETNASLSYQTPAFRPNGMRYIWNYQTMRKWTHHLYLQ